MAAAVGGRWARRLEEAAAGPQPGLQEKEAPDHGRERAGGAADGAGAELRQTAAAGSAGLLRERCWFSR